MEIICYAGGRGEYPENTIEGIRNCQSINSNWRIEIDLQMTKDGEIIVFHDDTTDRITELKAKVNELNFIQISQLNAGYHFLKDSKFIYRSTPIKIPKLEEVFYDFPTLNYLLDVHTNNILSVDKIINIVESRLKVTNNIIIVSKYDYIINRFKKLKPTWIYGASTIEAKAIVYSSYARLDNFFALESDILMLPMYLGKMKILSNRIINHVHQRDKKIWAWLREGKSVECINTIEELNKFKKLGIDGVFTDYPNNINWFNL